MARFAFLALLASALAQTCTNPLYTKIFPPLGPGIIKKVLINEDAIECDFSECKPMFTTKPSCNRIFLAYHPDMANARLPAFTFRTNKAPVSRSDFISDIYDPIVKTFERDVTFENDAWSDEIGGKSLFSNVGAIAALGAKEKMRNARSGDVLVYVANSYDVIDKLNNICQILENIGVVVLPVFVGQDGNISHLSLLADTQKTGSIIAEIRKYNTEFAAKATAGLILPACDSPSIGGVISTASRRTHAILMFAKLFAQCPNSCISSCRKTKSFNGPHIDFPQPPNGSKGCCGPLGESGASGVVGRPGVTGCTGATGDEGDAGPNGPQGAPGSAGRPGNPGPNGQAGPAGKNGPSGPSGGPGASGKNGQPGSIGPNGLPGSAGNNGPPGQDGPPGANGGNGRSGPQGPAGRRGVSGTSGIGMISPSISDGYNGSRDDLFNRALLEILQEDYIWEQVYNIENQKFNFQSSVQPIRSCDCQTP